MCSLSILVFSAVVRRYLFYKKKYPADPCKLFTWYHKHVYARAVREEKSNSPNENDRLLFQMVISSFFFLSPSPLCTLLWCLRISLDVFKPRWTTHCSFTLYRPLKVHARNWHRRITAFKCRTSAGNRASR